MNTAIIVTILITAIFLSALVLLVLAIAFKLWLRLRLRFYSSTYVNPKPKSTKSQKTINRILRSKNKHIVDITPDSFSPISLRQHTKPSSASNSSSDSNLTKDATAKLEKNSIIRLSKTLNLLQNKQLKTYTTPHNGLYQIYYEDQINTHSLNKGVRYSVPITYIYYSSLVDTTTAGYFGAIFNYSTGCGMSLAKVENELFVKSLYYHPNSMTFYNINDLASSYRLCLEFKKRNINNYYMLIPEKFREQQQALLDELRVPATQATPLFIPDCALDFYNISCILIEKTPNLKINLFNNKLKMSILNYNEDYYLEAINPMGLIITGLKMTCIGFSCNASTNSLLTGE